MTFSITLRTQAILFKPQEMARTQDGKDTVFWKGSTLGLDETTGEISLLRLINIFPKGKMIKTLSNAMDNGTTLLLVGNLRETPSVATNDVLSMDNPVKACYNAEGEFTLTFQGETHTYRGEPGKEVRVDNITEQVTLELRKLQPVGQAKPVASREERLARYAANQTQTGQPSFSLEEPVPGQAVFEQEEVGAL